MLFAAQARVSFQKFAERFATLNGMLNGLWVCVEHPHFLALREGTTLHTLINDNYGFPDFV